jgi:cytochrome P450
VGTSSLYLHTNPAVFPDPEKFDPSRWDNPTPEMEKSVVPFSRGKRMCPGKEISIMELFIVQAFTFRKFKLIPYNTTYVHLPHSILERNKTLRLYAASRTSSGRSMFPYTSRADFSVLR